MEVPEITSLAKDAAYVAVGFGLIGFQRAQVRRREIERRLEDIEAGLPPQARAVVETARSVAHDIEQQLRALGVPLV